MITTDKDYFTCSYCSSVFPVIPGTMTSHKNLVFKGAGFHNPQETHSEEIEVQLYKCPRCKEISIKVIGVGDLLKGREFNIRPVSDAIQFPEYIPLKIRQDYEEACAIVNLSPKASATLSRRCLQAIINDFWGLKEDRLLNSINKIEDKVTSSQWKAIDAIRKLGNIGAHPDMDINTIIDIEPEDAKKLIKIIELLIKQWYIERHEQEQLFSNVLQIKDTKEKQRKGKQ